MSIPWKEDEAPPKRVLGGLVGTEIFWRDHAKWLEESGYKLRTRYQPSWVPPWADTKKYSGDFEDGQLHIFGHIMDAIRVSDGADVMLKQLEYSLHPFEAEIGQLLSSPPLSDSPDNHCIPFSENIPIPDVEGWSLLVMPLLRRFDNPRFDVFSEAVDFFRQVLTGLRFMHQNNVAHRDINSNNVMMDATPLYLEPYHPVRINNKRDWSGPARHYTRTQRPVKYYLIDFGLSRQYAPEDKAPLEDIIIGGDKSVPEFQNPVEPCNPYNTDVYCMGNMVRTEFMQKMYGFEFMQPLVADMVVDTPSARPTMGVAVERFEGIVAKLSKRKLQSRIVYRDESFLNTLFLDLVFWFRRLYRFLGVGLVRRLGLLLNTLLRRS